jgi:mannose-6-phosphate isomerase
MLLATRTVEKPWGRDALPAPFDSPAGKRTGEIWFEPPRDLDELLVKFIFTSEKLSVQVHPSQEQALAAGLGGQGKDECWLVAAAGPGAVLGVGFERSLDAATLRQAALDGSIERMLEWHPVKAGDFYYIPANTVHAIGADVSIIEIQQNSDLTYRLYDYGRPRELHLEEAVAIARGEPHDPACRMQVPDDASATLVNGPYFRVDMVRGLPAAEIAAGYRGSLLVIPREGELVVEGERIAPGQCALAQSIDDVVFAPQGSCLLTRPNPGPATNQTYLARATPLRPNARGAGR